MLNPDSDKLSAGEAALILRVSARTVARMADQGLLRADVTEGGHRRFNRSDVEALAAERAA